MLSYWGGQQLLFRGTKILARVKKKSEVSKEVLPPQLVSKSASIAMGIIASKQGA